MELVYFENLNSNKKSGYLARKNIASAIPAVMISLCFPNEPQASSSVE